MPIRSRPPPFVFSFIVPLGVVANLGLGLVLLGGLNPEGWTGWLRLAVGVFCCVVAGALGAAVWSYSYWSRSMARQIALLRRIADTLFTWLEEVPLPAEALRSLNASLDEVMTDASKPKLS